MQNKKEHHAAKDKMHNAQKGEREEEEHEMQERAEDKGSTRQQRMNA